jgi:hypothetical protein
MMMNNTPKTSVLTVSYDKDLDFLKYNMKSYDTFCDDYTGQVIAIDDHDDDCDNTTDFLQSREATFHVNKDAKFVNRGYVRQQYIKFFSDVYAPVGTEYVCHVDSDSIFTNKHNPSIYFKHGKPVMGKHNYNSLAADLRESTGDENVVNAFMKWQTITQHALGFLPEHEYMCMMPLVYPVSIFPEVRNHIETTHGVSLLEYLKTKHVVSEYNIFGAWCYKFRRDLFHWIDRGEQPEEWGEYRANVFNVINRYSNRPNSGTKTCTHQYVDLSQSGNIVESIFE